MANTRLTALPGTRQALPMPIGQTSGLGPLAPLAARQAGMGLYGQPAPQPLDPEAELAMARMLGLLGPQSRAEGPGNR